MQEFWKWFLDFWPTIAAGVSGIFAAVATFLVCRIKLRTQKAKTAALLKELDNAKLRLTYTRCPHCGNNVKLADCHWKLPGDLADENLNGIPDNQED